MTLEVTETIKFGSDATMPDNGSKSVPAITHVSVKRREVRFENGVIILLCGYPRSVRQLSEAATSLYGRHLEAGFTHDEMVDIFSARTRA